MKLVLDEDGSHIQGTVSFGEEDSPLDLSKVDSSTITKALTAHHNPRIGILPPAVRWISAEKDLVVFERPPCYKHIVYSPADQSEANLVADHHFTLPIPWQVYVVQFNQEFIPVQVRCYANSGPLQSIDDLLWLLPLLNFYATGLLCNPVHGQYEAYEPTLVNGIHAAYNLVWNSGFNLDLKDALYQIQSQSKPFPVSRSFGSHTSLVKQMLHQWEKMSLAEAIAAEWPSGAILVNGEGVSTMSLYSILQVAQAEAHAATHDLAQRFIVHFINTMSAHTG